MFGLQCNQIHLTSWLNIITKIINIILTTYIIIIIFKPIHDNSTLFMIYFF